VGIVTDVDNETYALRPPHGPVNVWTVDSHEHLTIIVRREQRNVR